MVKKATPPPAGAVKPDPPPAPPPKTTGQSLRAALLEAADALYEIKNLTAERGTAGIADRALRRAKSALWGK